MKNFSLWCDFVEDSFLDTEFVELLQSGKINGATSNPAIFKNAILNHPSYKAKITKLKGKNAKEIYENLAIADIAKAADKLALNFFKKDDGFISLEIDPRLESNTALSIGEAKRLYSAIGKQNVMMKVPATRQSYEVMSVLMSEGISVNATLIFSLDQTKQCFEALNEGLKAFRKKNAALKGQLQSPQAVISVFVSRFDRLLNNEVLDKNQIGILNASLAYTHIKEQNEPNIRTLFASTGVKGDDLDKDYYIKALKFKHSINTAPLDAIKAYKNSPLLECESKSDLEKKLYKNISQDKLEKASKNLLDDGLKQFCIAYEEILQAIQS
ncbi:transaldolase [Campylobacter sp. MIT 12-5580]|uniref:transaldolase n=1 Tax=Campylobacter sp. MIT 12-5580 TaxID=2040651 RepID=UPI0010F58FD6|nr:transaldolase [Campylobacter sp. MIT 12-5580]TKX28356.1 transaldolase [Campylobacter sp. MIT 12-5580]